MASVSANNDAGISPARFFRVDLGERFIMPI